MKKSARDEFGPRKGLRDPRGLFPADHLVLLDHELKILVRAHEFLEPRDHK